MEPEDLLPFRNNRLFLPILNQISPVHHLPTDLIKIRFNIILPSTSRSSKWSSFFRLPHQNRVYDSPLPHTTHAPPISFPFLLSF